MHAQPSKFLNDNKILDMFKCNVSEILNVEMDENYQKRLNGCSLCHQKSTPCEMNGGLGALIDCVS